jgi:Cys-rich protein (TIGR01571 family)
MISLIFIVCYSYTSTVLLGQVMTRLKLTWSAQEDGNRTQASSTFRILVFLWIAWIITQIIMQSLKLALINESGELDAEVEFFVFLLNVLVLAFSLFFLIITCRTRRHIREKYQIPEQQCHGCEDCCCTYWCTCCTISQMARHTGDYANHGARWCSETGMPAGATISEIGLTPTVVNSIV